MHLGFNKVIATPSLSLPGTTSGSSRSPRLHDDSSQYPVYSSTISAIPLLSMVLGRIIHSSRLTEEVYCLVPAPGATSVFLVTSLVTLREGALLDAYLVGLQVGHLGHFCWSPMLLISSLSLSCVGSITGRSRVVPGYSLVGISKVPSSKHRIPLGCTSTLSGKRPR